MADLKNGPEDLMSLLPFMRCILGVFHFVAEFEECIFQIVKAIRWGLAITR